MIPDLGRGASRLVGLALVFGLAGWLLAAVPTSAASPGPTLTVTPVAASVRGTVVVQGQGFPPQLYNLQVAVCGNLGLNGTADCDTAAARTTFTSAVGSFSLNLVVTMPPKPCPCAIVASAPGVSDLVKAPFTVVGAPVATPAAPPPTFEQKTLKVENAKLEGSGDWQSWFGAATTRDLVFTIHNMGTTPVDDPPLTLTAGKGRNPEGVVTPPRIGHIEPGARRTVRADVPFEPLSFGRYTVRGRIGNTGAEETFRVHTSTYPWGLFALVIVVLQIILLGMRNVLRRRIAAREARKHAADRPEPAAARVTASPEPAGWEEDQAHEAWAVADDEWTDDEWTDDEWTDDEQMEDGWTEDERTYDEDATSDADSEPAGTSTRLAAAPGRGRGGRAWRRGGG